MSVIIANPKVMNRFDYMCKSTDEKPTSAEDGAILWVWDTNEWFVFDADEGVENWAEVGGNA